MNIGILGSGDVGRRLGDGFIELGHTVKIGSRSPNQEKIIEWMAKHEKVKVSSGSFTEAASFPDNRKPIIKVKCNLIFIPLILPTFKDKAVFPCYLKNHTETNRTIRCCDRLTY